MSSAWTAAVAVVVLLGACSRVDPELASRRDALARWEAGVSALDAGDAETALKEFRRAQILSPGQPLLGAWEAQAMAARGDVQGAITRLDEVLAADPGLAAARYNRAAYLARKGRVAEAAAELKRALDDGAARPRDVLEDPDFAPYVHERAFDFLPIEPLAVAVELSDELVFWGSDVRLRLRIRGADGPFISVTPERAEGPVRLLTVVEDVVPSTDGPVHDLTYTLRAAGAGPIAIGPLHVWAGRHRALVEGVELVAKAPAERADPGPLRPLVLSTPRELALQAEVPSARVLPQGLAVLTAPGDRVEVQAEPAQLTDVVRYELREGGAPVWTLRLYPDGAAAKSVTVTRAGNRILSGPPVQ